jgi:hypothetical protein
MDLNELFEQGYEIMAMTNTKDAAYDLAELYMENDSYSSFAIAPYKRRPGEEDAYAVLLI